MASDKIDVERTIVRIQNEVSDLVLRKKETEFEISALNSKVRSQGHLRQPDYDRIVKRQLELRSDLFEYDRQIQSRKQTVRTLSVEKQLLPKPEQLAGAESKVVSELRYVRDKYLEFSKDKTRLEQLRDLSEAVVKDLNVIISSHVRREERP